MVSSIDLSTRLTATKLALKAIREQEDNSAATSTSSRTTLLNSYGIDTTTSTSSSNTRLTQLLAQYAQTSGNEAESGDTDKTAASGDITQADFMKDLKATLDELSGDPAKAAHAKSMLEALAAGTLTVSNPADGVKIKAWDVTDDPKTASKPATAIATAGWSDFLKDHLKRDGAAYAKGANGAYIDGISGDNAFFGSVGSRYYYLTWPQAKDGTLTV
ncbi:hypothetical protein N5C66_03220 [Rhizobium pusense]|uniref:hypothetical protein n=1 Tax=Agrobacterium pusense TaxID=648995 RepID=UPI000D19AA8D|nr:hypothetical protein [Agrobacterium pusense]MDH0908333.1 hypothetical protein [Agrobacterium pusense]MDH1094165.1 hypothetical protein [Agrobacterium pusense]MDH1110746.1 hypothetical protein [Agrobacterium pusense]MDH2192249.1 hypothetical protein [Agrobacterium pusense]